MASEHDFEPGAGRDVEVVVLTEEGRESTASTFIPDCLDEDGIRGPSSLSESPKQTIRAVMPTLPVSLN
jgi:hypothetical protein